MEEKASICCYTPFDRKFPQKLRDYSQMPEVLYVKGRLPNPKRKSVAIVGARVCSHYGAFWAYEFAKVLAEHGVQIISGLAKGIDSCAHKGALEAGGDTFAVLGCGVDVCYPRQNQDLYRRMVQGKGGILSEFEAGDSSLCAEFSKKKPDYQWAVRPDSGDRGKKEKRFADYCRVWTGAGKDGLCPSGAGRRCVK